MGRVASRKTFNQEFLALGLSLPEDEIAAIWTVAGVFQDVQMMIPQKDKWIILHLKDGHISGKEWRHG